jgi:hypothetical protein
MSVVGATTEVEFQFCVWSSGGGWRGRGVSWSNVAAGRFPASLHFWQTNRPARSCTHVVATCGRTEIDIARYLAARALDFQPWDAPSLLPAIDPDREVCGS